MLAIPTLIVPLLVSPAPAATAPAATAPAAPAPVTAPAAVHCQVPCGIYGDHLRIELLKEHAATIEKAMKEIERLGAETPTNFNQIVRWVSTKEEHCQIVQDQVAQYWLAQRIKEPKDSKDMAAAGKYATQLVSLHRMTVSAMKCKQTTDAANVQNLLNATGELAKAYFSAEDLEHLHLHSADEHPDDGHSHDADHADHSHDGEKKGGR